MHRFLTRFIAALGASAALAGSTLSLAGDEPVRVDPAIWRRALEGINRDAASLAETGGRVTVVHFWADWCGPCKDELPKLQRFYRQAYPALKERGLRVVTVSNDFDRSGARKVIERFDLTVPVFHDPEQRLNRALAETRALPLTVLIDAQRRAQILSIGPFDWKKEKLAKLLSDARPDG